MGLETRLYLVPLVEVEEHRGETIEVRPEYKVYLYLYGGGYHWAESMPADNPTWRMWKVTADETVHAQIRADADIDEL